MPSHLTPRDALGATLPRHREDLITPEQLRALIRSAIERGVPIGDSTFFDQLADSFTPEFLLKIARRRDFGVRLSQDGRRADLDDEVPLWFARAAAIYEPQIVELMNISFLGQWRG